MRDAEVTKMQIPDVRAIRRTIAQLSYSARSGHVGSSLSCVNMFGGMTCVASVKSSASSQPVFLTTGMAPLSDGA